MLTKEQENNYLSSLYKLHNNSISISKSDSLIQDLFEKEAITFFQNFEIFFLPVRGNFPIIERITVNKRVNHSKNERIYEPQKLSYPPKKYISKYGRANLKEQSVFYGTFDFITAMQEMAPEIGDIITISKWRNMNGQDLIVCPMFVSKPKIETKNIQMLNIYNLLHKEAQKKYCSNFIMNVMSFYAHCFAEEIDHTNNKTYIFTALLSDKILHQYENGIIDAILYPSVKNDQQTNNIAIKPTAFDRNYELYHTIEKRVISVEKNNEYRLEILGQSKKIMKDYIEWQDIYFYNFSDFKNNPNNY